MIELKKEVNELCDRLGQPPRYPLEFETKRLMPSEATTGEGVRAAPRIHAEVESRFGVLPNFFRLAPESPEVTANLWGFARFAYLDNPLPALFKERLFVYLSRFCEVRYCVARHVGFLIGLGRPSGDVRSPVQTIDEVIRLLRRPLPRGEHLRPYISYCFAGEPPLPELPEADSKVEDAIFACATHTFLQTPQATECLVALKRCLGDLRFQHLMAFLAFVRTAHYWTKVHPELALEEDIKQLLAAHEILAECLFNDPEAETCDISQRLMDESTLVRKTKEQHDELLRVHQTLRESQDRLKHTNDELAQRVGELEKVNIEIRESRRAALNVMEDALKARQQVETLNRQLQKENSERRQAEEALRQRAAQFESLINEAPLGVYLVDADFRIRQVNPTALPVFGDIPDLIGRDFDEVIHILWTKENADEIVRIFRHTLETGEPYITHERAEFRADRGVTEYYEWRIDRITLPDGRFGAVCYFRDISAQVRARETIAESEEQLRSLNAELEKRVSERTAELLSTVAQRDALQEQLLQAQKMESIGTLAGGIAHDFNNILNIIQGYTFILRGYGSHNRQIEENLTVINETVQRGTALVQQLLTLARKSSTKIESVNANALIEGMIALVTQTFAKTIELSCELEADLPPITADKNQIEQALLNLCVNARDAMPNGGRLSFRTQSVEGAALQGLGVSIGGRYVCIELSDTGVGMDESIRRRIFEPFFTTKGAGHGTGLGLSVVYGIVKNHSGFINVESKPMFGTSFRLYFPIALSEISTGEPLAARDTKIMTTPNGKATVLLVDDEEHMLHLLEKILSKHGYTVLKASDGETAIKIYQGHKQTIDAVLLDLGLPKVAGRDVLLRLKDENPDLKVIISSGYLEPELESEVDRAGVKHFLPKPYLPNEVIKIFQSVVERES